MIKKLMRIFFVFFILILFPISYSSGIAKEYYANVSYSNVDSKVIDDLKVKEWTPVVVRLYDNSGLRFTSNITLNREIYEQRGEYFYEIEDIVLSTLSEEEFILDRNYLTHAGFSGFITCKGLRKLTSDLRVEYIEGNYGEVSIGPIRSESS